jgi:hypothetical protein
MLIGTGALAREVGACLATADREPLDIVVVGRSAAKAAEVGYIVSARAATAARAMAVRTAGIDLEDEDALTRALAAESPVGVLLCASVQSPWEHATAPSAWTDLLSCAGFAVTLPLQARLALRVGRTVPRASPAAWLVNACYPDAVNRLLQLCGIPVLCGIGNVAILQASLRAALALDGAVLRVLGHHLHLHAPADAAQEARAWSGARPLAGVGTLLAAQRQTGRPELNRVTGYAAALLLASLCAGRPVRASLPGPLGLPGGYPVRITGGRLTLDLPADLRDEDAIAANETWARLDGVVVGQNRVRYAPRVLAALDRVRAGHAADFHPQDVAEAAAQMLALRERLRRQPVPARPRETNDA